MPGETSDSGGKLSPFCMALVGLLLSTEILTAQSSSHHSDVRESKLEDVWRPLPSLRLIRYNTKKNIKSRNTIRLNATDDNEKVSAGFTPKIDNLFSKRLNRLINCSVMKIAGESKKLADSSDTLKLSEENAIFHIFPLDNVRCTFNNTQTNRLLIEPILAEIISFRQRLERLYSEKHFANIVILFNITDQNYNYTNNEESNAILTTSSRESLGSNDDGSTNLPIPRLVSLIKGKIYLNGIHLSRNNSDENPNNTRSNSDEISDYNLNSKLPVGSYENNTSSSLILSIKNDNIFSEKMIPDDVVVNDEENSGEWQKLTEWQKPVNNRIGPTTVNQFENDKGQEDEFFPDSLSRLPGHFSNHESLDDLILHHTSSSMSRPRPSVILIHDVPDEFLPKPPPAYLTTTLPPATDSTGPLVRPTYVPVVSGHLSKPPHQKPSYHLTTHKPVFIPVHNKPTSIFHGPNPIADPVSEPVMVPVYHHKPQKPIYHYSPKPEPEPDISHKPIYNKPTGFWNDPSPEPPPLSHPKPSHHSDQSNPVSATVGSNPVHYVPILQPEPQYHKPISRPTNFATEAAPSIRPVHYYTTGSPLSSQTPPVTQGPPLGPTIIFVHPPVPTTSTPLFPVQTTNAPSPVNPVTIPEVRPPPSIVLLPPLSDSPSYRPSVVCPQVFVTNHQTVHASADFKDECSGNINVIINSPLETDVEEGQSAVLEPEDDEIIPTVAPEEQEEEDDLSDEEHGSGGGGGGSSGVLAILPAPIIIGAGGGGVIGTTAGVGEAAVGAGAPVTPKPVSHNDPVPTKRPSAVTSQTQTQSMSIWDYMGSVLNSFVIYPLWTVLFAPFSLLLASGLGVAALVFPWAFPRFWFGRRRRKRRKRSVSSFEDLAIGHVALIFEKKLKLNYNFDNDFKR